MAAIMAETAQAPTIAAALVDGKILLLDAPLV